MAPRKRAPKGYYYDKKTKRHEWTIEYQGRRYRIRDQDEEAARRKFEELKRRLFAGADVQGAKVLLSDYLPSYINTEVTGKQSTIDDYHKRADLYILPTLGRYAVGEIKRWMVVAWVNGMMNEPHPDTGKYWARSSVKQALALLRRALQAIVPEHLEHNPAADVKVPVRRKGDEYKIDDQVERAKVFTPEQMETFLAEVLRTDARYGHGLYVYYVLAAELGWRRGEGLGLRRKDIDFDQAAITIRQQVTRNTTTNEIRITTPKTDAGRRELPVSDDGMALLREQCLRSGAWARPDALVFPDKNGERRKPDSVTQHFRRTCLRLGLIGFNLHSLRKYAITDWRAAGADLEVAAAMAGHAGIKVTAETYSQATMERKRAAVNRKKTS
jgi:integrase